MYQRSHEQGRSASMEGVYIHGGGLHPWRRICIHGGGSASCIGWGGGGAGVVLNRGGLHAGGLHRGGGSWADPPEIHGILRYDT